MPRSKRQWISQQAGSFHIISRTSGARLMLDDEEKEYFLKLLERFAAGFFVQIHAFAVMGNHFHILATGLELEAMKASRELLIERYRLMYGKTADPPGGTYDDSGNLIPDADDGTGRLRERLGSISRFVQELKQTFSHWYNKRHDREGYLWSDRFKGVLVENGEAHTVCSAYIDLNPVRAKLATKPEDYRWCSLGLWVRDPRRAGKLLGDPLAGDSLARYREFVYMSGGIERQGKGHIAAEWVEEVRKYHGTLGIGDQLGFRVRNFSEGLALGSHSFISGLQERLKRKYIRPRAFMKGAVLFCTRVLRL